MDSNKILVTGSNGLIGSELVPALIEQYGIDNVIASDLKQPDKFDCQQVALDVTDTVQIEKLIVDHDIGTVYHLAGLLSAGSENNPDLGWKINFGGLKNILDIAREHKFKIFWPSSIAAFGETTPKADVPQHTVLEPSTIYGVAKVAGELMCAYYHRKYGVDVRSLRYPGIIGYAGEPGDGTTEYAIHIFYSALKSGKYECFLKGDSKLPMMYMDDAIRGTIELMEAPSDQISIRTSYNFAGISFTPAELASEIQKHTALEITYKPDFHQPIADSWPTSIDDNVARSDWGWKPKYLLPEITTDMLVGTKKKLAIS